MSMIPKSKLAPLEELLEEAMQCVTNLEEEFGDEGQMNERSAERIQEILDLIGAFVSNSVN